MIADQIDEDAREANESLNSFLGRMQKASEAHNITPATAIRWEMEADGIEMSDGQGIEHYFWGQGLYPCETYARAFMAAAI